MNENIEKVLATLDGFRMSDEMTYSAYSVLYDEISLLDDLLKVQEPNARVVTLEELSALPIDTPVFIEEINDECGWNVFYGIDEENDVCFCGFKATADYYDLEEYGMSWRCWTSRPTDEQRRATPWN